MARGQSTVANVDHQTQVSAAGIASFSVLDVPISITSLPAAVETIIGWCLAKRSHFVCVRDVHGIMRAQNDADLMGLHASAGLVTPDGMPLVWLAKSRGLEGVERTCGSDLVVALCKASIESGLRHYFYGGKPGVADRLAGALIDRFPGLQVAGTYSPPFMSLTPDEDAAITSAIAAAQPHIVWVGLSTPTQEFWMRDHVGKIPGATLIGVGAAFDFHTGDVKRAPMWMRNSGFEWLHRLISEPRRLWKRYLLLAPKFVLLLFTRCFSRKHG